MGRRIPGAPLVVVLALSIAYRGVALANAAQTNSDAAVVGLQAMHLARGEWSWFLWGSGYQTSVDAIAAAITFAILGPTALALMLSSLALHLGVTALAWSAIARRVNGAAAAIAVLPLVFATSPLETYVLYPPREASIFFAVLALWLLDRAGDAEGVRGARRFAIGGAVLALACFADPYALVLAPPIAAFGVACAKSGARVAALAGGGAVGAVPFALLRLSDRARGGVLSLGIDRVAHNACMLLEPCLPWTLGAESWGANRGAMTYVKQAMPAPIAALQTVGGAIFLAALVVGAGCVFARRIAWPVRRLAIAGGLGLVVTIAGFLASPMVMDLFSSRYLASITVLAPFALAPLASALGNARFAALVAPCAAASAIAGWVGLGPLLDPPPNGTDDEAALEAALDARGVHAATADYWTAYRLTFLARERLVVVPTNAAEDRYAPYRAAFDAAPRVAYVFDPLRSREDAAWMETRVAAGETPFDRAFERVTVGRFTLLLLRRAAAAGSCNRPAPRSARAPLRTRPG